MCSWSCINFRGIRQSLAPPIYELLERFVNFQQLMVVFALYHLQDPHAPLNFLNHFKKSAVPSGCLKRRSAATRLLRSWVWIPPRAWMFVCCECCVLLGRGLCDELITRPEESYRLWCDILCDLETSRMRRPWLALGRSATEKKNFKAGAWDRAPFPQTVLTLCLSL